MRNAAPVDLEKFRTFLRSGMPGPHAYVVLLGISRFDLPGIIDLIEKGLPFTAYQRFEKNSGLTSDQLGQLLQIPRRTLARRRVEGRFTPDESDRLVRASRVYAKALDFFSGDPVEATRWLNTIRRALGGVTPLEMARTEIGSREVEDLLGRLEHGVFS